MISWGLYGALLYQGQVLLRNPLKALLCVGIAYFLVGVVVPVAALSAQGGMSGFNKVGVSSATGGGALGAIGAVCIIWAFRTGGLPLYVMPLVFDGARIVNVLSGAPGPCEAASSFRVVRELRSARCAGPRNLRLGTRARSNSGRCRR